MYNKKIIDTKVYILPAAIGALGAVAASAIGGILSHKSGESNKAFQERMYDKQYQDSVKFWQLQQDYNTPQMQLSRLRDAGINPMLYYGQSGAMSGNIAQQAPEVPSMPQGSQQSYHFENPFAGIVQALRLRQELAESRSREYKNYKEAEGVESEMALRGLQGEQIKIDTQFQKDSYQTRMDLLKSEKDLKDSMFYLNYRQANQLNKSIQLMDKQIENYESEIAARKEITQAQVNKMSEEIQMGWKRLTGELSLMSAQARNALANAYAATVNANIAKGLYSSEYIKIIQGKAGQEFLNAIRSGDAQLLQNGLLAKEFEMTAGYDTTAGKIRYWCDNVVKPITGIISDVAVTAGGAGIAAKSFSSIASSPTVVKGFGQ